MVVTILWKAGLKEADSSVAFAIQAVLIILASWFLVLVQGMVHGLSPILRLHYLQAMQTLAQPTTAPTAPLRNYRLNSIDLLRGLVMVIMALDHARDLLHVGALTADPLDLQTTTPFLFFTRWITHYCAPVFVFLSGTSIYLQGLRKSKKELSLFLLKRGLWLIVAEVLLVSLGISFDPYYSFIFLQVIWAIGISMVLLAALIWLPFPVLLALGTIILLGHNGLDAWEAKQKSFSLGYSLLHRQNFLPFGDGRFLGILYPFLPWTGIMILGYCTGRIYQLESGLRRKWIAGLGAALVLFFVVLRFTNLYGDPQPWSGQVRNNFTLLSFINTTKYPPSLLFACMTIGPALLFLAIAEGWRGRLASVLTVYGRVPLFYYLLHFYLLHLLAAVLFVSRGGTVAEGFKGVEGVPFKFVVPGVGLQLWQVYLAWVGVVALLYPLCRWYGRYKQEKRYWWLSYV